MGTTYKVVLINYDDNEVERNVFNVLNSVNKEMSTYLKTSIISELNESKIDEWVYVSDNFLKVAVFSQETCLSTEGSFNISIGYFVNYYGFGPPEIANSYNDSKLMKLRDQISCSSYKVDSENKRIKRLNDVYLDMSAVAKGFAIDLLSSYLDSYSIDSYFIELGGEIKYKGHKSPNQAWLVAIENPDLPSSPILTLSSKEYENLSLATSGEYRNFSRREGNLISHTIDPITFKPINKKHISVSVIAENVMKADALATALNVMGLEKGLEYSNKNHIKTLYIVKEEGNLVLKTSKWF